MTSVIFLFLFFAFLGFLLAILFFFKTKGDYLGNMLLGVYTLLFSFELLINVLRWSEQLITATYVHFNLLHFPLWTIYGALVYLYVRRIITKKGFLWSDILFLIPSIVVIALVFQFYRLPTADKLTVVNENKIFDYAIWPSYTIWIVIGIMTFYAFYTFLKFWNKPLGFREYKWLKWFVGSYLGFVAVFTLYIFLTWFKIMDPKYDYFIDCIIVFFIAMLSFFGFVQPDIFDGKNLNEVVPFVKYKKTGLTTLLSLEMKQKLMYIMEHKKIYLNPEIRLNDVAESLDIHKNHASQIINEHFNLSFFDFINSYRIAEAKVKIVDVNSKKTITDIGFEVGFNNRASFHKAFKKSTGLSPLNFKKQSANF
tara:strand:+ start:17735 stop:18835 length:1101 start_codon:yes stop_codon:yes gene_type:complete